MAAIIHIRTATLTVTSETLGGTASARLRSPLRKPAVKGELRCAGLSWAGPAPSLRARLMLACSSYCALPEATRKPALRCLFVTPRTLCSCDRLTRFAAVLPSPQRACLSSASSSCRASSEGRPQGRVRSAPAIFGCRPVVARARTNLRGTARPLKGFTRHRAHPEEIYAFARTLLFARGARRVGVAS